MNKYLLMSAAAIMGFAMVPARAGTFIGTIGLWNAKQTLNYCDSIKLYSQSNDPGAMVAIHGFAYCNYYSTYYAVPLPMLGAVTSTKRGAVTLGDIDIPAFYDKDWITTYEVQYPYKVGARGKLKTRWDCYYSTNGTTAFFSNSGVEGPYTYPNRRAGVKPESTISRLAERLHLKVRPKADNHSGEVPE